MQSFRNLFGFFQPVKDAELALRATKLSGLTALTAGILLLFPLFSELIYLASAAVDTVGKNSMLFAAIGIFLIVCAFVIRSGSLILIPIIVPVMLVVLIYWIAIKMTNFSMIVGALIDHGDAVAIITFIFFFLLRIFVPIALVALAVNGLRGWNWLRRFNAGN